MVNVLKIPLYDGTLASAVSEMIAACSKKDDKENRCINAIDAHCLVYARKNEAFRNTLMSSYMNLPDGLPAVWVGRVKGAPDMERCYGPDFFERAMVESADKPLNHFLCGGTDGVAEELRQACSKKFGNRNVVGVYTPPFREMTEEEWISLAADIKSRSADIVWIGVSTPRQQMFAKRLASYTKVHFLVTVGAAFDFHTSRVRQAPKAVQRAGLEWFFRICMEPGRLWKRYVEVVPLFIWYNVWEYVLYMSGRTTRK